MREIEGIKSNMMFRAIEYFGYDLKMNDFLLITMFAYN